MGKGLFGAVQIALIVSAFLGSAIVTPALAAPSANLDQCSNDPAPSPNTDGCTNASDWVNGNLNANQALYFEGDSIPYRIRMGDLDLTSHTIQIAWDTTQGGKHAIDYLTTFNRTVATATPCAGVPGCGAATTFPIPPDPQVTGAGVTPVAGNFTMFGGTITAVSAYSLGVGFPAGNNIRAITITFTATQANPVLAWGGHIASRVDWGLNNSAVAIDGSPFHMRLLALDGSGGNQDRGLAAGAVVFPAAIRIVKNTVGGDGTFDFTAGPAPLANFQITTVGGTGDHLFGDIINFQKYTINETPIPQNWTFTSLTCATVSPNGGLISTSGAIASIDLKEGEGVTCTYTDTLQPPALTVTKTADAASVSAGDPIGFTVTITNGGTGTATGVTLTDALPGGSGTGVTWVKDLATGDPAAFTLAGAQGSQTLTLAGQPISLAPGATLSVHVTAQTSATECSTYNNTATVASTNDGGGSAPASITCASAALTVTKTADAASVSAGDPIGYTVTITNGGTGTATGVTLTDALPGGSGTGVTWVKDLAPATRPPSRWPAHRAARR